MLKIIVAIPRVIKTSFSPLKEISNIAISHAYQLSFFIQTKFAIPPVILHSLLFLLALQIIVTLHVTRIPSLSTQMGLAQLIATFHMFKSHKAA